jgi:DNA-binding MarR family transcriptional regulator
MPPSLRDEIQQTKPFTSPREEAYLNLQRTAALLEQQLLQFFKPWDLTPTQYNVLRILRGAAPSGLPCREVGNRMVTPVPDVTRLLDRLESKGWVARGRAEADRRVVLTTITPSGEELLGEIDRPLSEQMEEMLGHVDEDELRRLNEILFRARNP